MYLPLHVHVHVHCAHKSCMLLNVLSGEISPLPAMHKLNSQMNVTIVEPAETDACLLLELLLWLVIKVVFL